MPSKASSDRCRRPRRFVVRVVAAESLSIWSSKTHRSSRAGFARRHSVVGTSRAGSFGVAGAAQAMLFSLCRSGGHGGTPNQLGA